MNIQTHFFKKRMQSLFRLSEELWPWSKQDQKFWNKNTHLVLNHSRSSFTVLLYLGMRQAAGLHSTSVTSWPINRGNLGCGNVRPMESRSLNFWMEIAPVFNLPECLGHGTFPWF